MSEDHARLKGDMDPELRTYLQELRTYLDEHFEGIDRRFERIEQSDRHTRVLVEDLRGEIRLVAEAFVGLQESREADRTEVTRETGGVKSILAQSYSALDHRILDLEQWRERRDRDPVAVIREWLAKPR